MLSLSIIKEHFFTYWFHSWLGWHVFLTRAPPTPPTRGTHEENMHQATLEISEWKKASTFIIPKNICFISICFPCWGIWQIFSIFREKIFTGKFPIFPFTGRNLPIPNPTGEGPEYFSVGFLTMPICFRWQQATYPEINTCLVVHPHPFLQYFQFNLQTWRSIVRLVHHLAY